MSGARLDFGIEEWMKETLAAKCFMRVYDAPCVEFALQGQGRKDLQSHVPVNMVNTFNSMATIIVLINMGKQHIAFLMAI
jgi:hypothetical protein